MIVYLLRHGEAEQLGDGRARTDAERRLTEPGRERLHNAGHAWRQIVRGLDRLYSSPLTRARETAAVLGEELRFTGDIEQLDSLVPEADADAIVRVIEADASEGLEAVACVGHEPHLGDTLGLLLLGRGAIPLKKGMLVGVELQGPTAAGSRLVCCLTTKVAGRLGER